MGCTAAWCKDARACNNTALAPCWQDKSMLTACPGSTHTHTHVTTCLGPQVVHQSHNTSQSLPFEFPVSRPCDTSSTALQHHSTCIASGRQCGVSNPVLTPLNSLLAAAQTLPAQHTPPHHTHTHTSDSSPLLLPAGCWASAVCRWCCCSCVWRASSCVTKPAAAT